MVAGNRPEGGAEVTIPLAAGDHRPCRGPWRKNMETEERLLLLVEDDEAFARTLSRSFERRGYRVLLAASLPEVEALLASNTPDYAVVDLKIKGEASGLACVLSR